MGSDQLFHRRKAKKAAALRREAQKRAPYDLVLIVCEGGKTEPNYLAGQPITPPADPTLHPTPANFAAHHRNWRL